MKKILITLILIIGLTGLGNADTDIQSISVYHTGSTSGSGYTNNGDTMYNDLNIVGNFSLHAASYFIWGAGRWHDKYSGIIKCTYEPSSGDCSGTSSCNNPYAICYLNHWSSENPGAGSAYTNGYITSTCDASTYICANIYICGVSAAPASYGYVKAYGIYTSDPIYHISGTTDCLSNVSLYYNNSGTWTYMGEDYLDDDYYSFNVTTGIDFKLLFDDGHSHEFNATDNMIYDYDGCLQTSYRFEESCGNLIPDSEGYYLEWNPSGWWNMETYFEESDGILDISNSSATKISIYTNSFIGSTGWLIDPVATDNTYTLENPNIAWALKVIVQNESDDALIDGAMVKVDQSCYCTDGYSTRQKLTVNGMSQFGDMSLQDASLFVMKTGYKILDKNTTGYAAFLSGRSNFSSKTWVVKLANTSSNNSSTFYEVANKVDIHFRDVNGNITSKILDTDAYVFLYYENNNTEEAMTLEFQSSSTHTYFFAEAGMSWIIPHGEKSHKMITNAYFTPWDYSYRAVIYNSSIYGWNITIPLTVRNGTRETEQHYQNLTTNLWFMYASDGKVDYRDDLKVAIHAQSNNTTLLGIDVELWIDGVYSGCKNLTATDFTDAEVPYYYVWGPAYNYVSGSNYSIRMYGFDRTLLETDYIECITDDTTRKNKLTIIVKNHYGTNLDNAFIYLEDYGSLPTGTNYYNSYEGLDNGYYRFKATKPGYTGTGWNDITLSDSDEIVTYVLKASASAEGGATQPQKMDDTTLRNLYIPLMALLLILILFGGLKSVL